MAVTVPVYLDHNSTTPVDPRVLESMMPYFTQIYGNPASSTHCFGSEAANSIEVARSQVADALGADATDIVFTSGATESNNLALKGIAEAYAAKGDHVITSVTEHKATLTACRHLQRHGLNVTYLPVDGQGLICPDDLSKAITTRTVLVSIMAVNNETGVIQPLASLGKVCRTHGVLFHTDAVQAFGKLPFDVNEMYVDLASVTAHKIYGPKGIGALYVRGRNPRVRLVAQIDGSEAERGARSGTLNVPGIVGFGAAAELAQREMPIESPRIERLRDRLHHGLLRELEDVQLHGDPIARSPGTLSLGFKGINAVQLMASIENEIAISSGSACTSTSLEPSHVLLALGADPELAFSSLRFSVGRFTSEEDIDFVTKRLIAEITCQRGTRAGSGHAPTQ